jgi:hypothetical protein
LQLVLLYVAFPSKLVGVLSGVAPLNVPFLILPGPWLDDNYVPLVNPRPIFHAAGDSAHPINTILTLHSDVITTIVLGHNAEQLVIIGHPEIPATLFLFAHTRI